MYPPALKDPRGGHNRSQVNQDFFQIWSPSMSYILGFIFADGAIEDVQTSSRTCYLAITSVDVSILEEIKIRMNSSHQLYLRRAHLVTHADGKSYVSKDSFILRIGSKSIYNDLLKLGVTPRKSLTIPFPKIQMKYFSFFLRGYFDGDGCLHLKNKRFPCVIFTSGSLGFLQSLNLILTRNLKIPLASLITNNSKLNPYYQLRYNKLSSLKILEFMYKDLEKAPYLNRKFAIYQKYLRSQN